METLHEDQGLGGRDSIVDVFRTTSESLEVEECGNSIFLSARRNISHRKDLALGRCVWVNMGSQFSFVRISISLTSSCAIVVYAKV